LSWIPPDKDGIRWRDIEEKARRQGTSLSTVRKYLKLHEIAQNIERRVNPDMRPPSVYYVRTADRYFAGLGSSITKASPFFRQFVEEYGGRYVNSLTSLLDALDKDVTDLRKIKDSVEQGYQQGRLFLYYGNILQVLLSNLFVDYSAFESVPEANRFLGESADTFIKPLLLKMAALADPRFGRCKYAMEDARGATLKGLLFEVKHYDRMHAKFKEFLESVKTRSKNAEQLREEYLKLVIG
jgi:hypothetical protein